MTLLVDSRVGSKDLAKPLSAKLAVLEFADAMFVGGGLGDKPIFIGIEVKTVKDALSCVVSGRFAGHQLPGLVKGYDVVYLIVEGRWRADKEGLLEVPYGKRWRAVNLGRRYFMWRDFALWLTSKVQTNILNAVDTPICGGYIEFIGDREQRSNVTAKHDVVVQFPLLHSLWFPV